MEEEKLDQLSVDAEKIMDELLVAPSPSRAKGKMGRRKSLIPELDNVVSSDSDSDSSSTDSDVSVSTVKRRERRLKPRSNKHKTMTPLDKEVILFKRYIFQFPRLFMECTEAI